MSNKLHVHDLKTWPEYFNAIVENIKKFEIRKNDRDFCVGEHLRLLEYDPREKKYTGRLIVVEITYIFRGGHFGVGKDYCVMSIANVDE